MDVVGYLTAFGLSTAAGLNAWFPLLAVGLLAKYTDLLDLTGHWEVLSTTPVLIGLLLVSILDFVGDKIAAVDSVLHAVGTVVAPTTGIVSGLSATGTLDVSPVAITLIGLVAAETTHGTRTAIRPFVTVSTGGLGNPVVSLVEDVFSAGLAFAAIAAPVVALLLIMALAWGAWRFLRRMRRRGRRGGPEPPPAPA